MTDRILVQTSGDPFAPFTYTYQEEAEHHGWVSVIGGSASDRADLFIKLDSLLDALGEDPAIVHVRCRTDSYASGYVAKWYADCVACYSIVRPTWIGARTGMEKHLEETHPLAEVVWNTPDSRPVTQQRYSGLTYFGEMP